MTTYNKAILKDGINNLMPLLGEYNVENPVIDSAIASRGIVRSASPM